MFASSVRIYQLEYHTLFLITHPENKLLVIHIYLVLCYTAHLYTAQKRVSDPMRLELQAVTSHLIPPPHWNHYKYHHLLVTNIQPHWQQHNCLQGEFSFYLPKAIPHPSPKDSIMCRADRTLKHTVYLFPLAHLYLLFSHPKLFLWNLRHFDGPVYPVTQNSRVSSPWSIPQNPSGGNLLLLWAVRDAIEIESVSSNLPDGKKVQWSKAEFNDLSWLNREGKKEDKVSLANKLQRVSNA